MHPDEERLPEYPQGLYLTVKAFRFHCKKTVTLVFPRCGEVFVVTEAERFGARVK
jgi:hypothetical protein